MDKSYNFKKYEADIYGDWEKSGVFNPDNLDLPDDALPYTIILPPPNITDKLHLGHSSMLAIEDLMIRYRRMRGYRALWLPGTDHAAIATQNVVEKKLLKEEGKTRYDLGREEFLKKVWEFLRETQSIILKQTRSMGSSLDWSREAFTLDEKRADAVRKMFVDMYNEGVIYRGERVINWCPRCASTLADDEIEYKKQKAKLYTFKYDKDFPIEIASTRPETKLGDTAVAVNPKDERYKKYIDKSFEVDFLGIKLSIKVIADWHIDMNFGTGALGVTPAHSHIDAQMAVEHKLPSHKVINEEGRIHDGFGKFSRLDVVRARDKVIAELRKKGLLSKEEDIENNLSICYRCDAAIEPLPSKQWFISVDKKLARLGNKSLKEKAIEAGEEKAIRFIPDRFSKQYLDWMNSLHDWCISRQIWFGHRIPAFYCQDCGEVSVSLADIKKCPKCNSVKIKQDDDSLDTWFSSGMWTFSTLGWPKDFVNGEKRGDLKKFHPTQMLETGYEIITLWVSRMIIMSLFALGEIPFESVYLHGMVLDKKGKKMSKSKGNGIDPLDMIEKFGTDALRLSLLIGSTPGNDFRVSAEKIEGQRNFINKLWNIYRYGISSYKFGEDSSKINYQEASLADIWIVKTIENLILEVTDCLENYKFSQAGEKLREFTRDDLADWYLEVTKFQKSKETEKVLHYVFINLLKLWHPFIPFVTELLWDNFKNDKKLIISEWPIVKNKHKKRENILQGIEFETIKSIIISIRNARSENKIEPGRRIKALIIAGDKVDLIKKNEVLIKRMRTGIEKIEVREKASKPEKAIFVAVDEVDIYLLGAIDTEKEKKRLKIAIEKLIQLVASIEKKLANKEFLANAPQEIVSREKKRLKECRAEKEKLEKQREKI